MLNREGTDGAGSNSGLSGANTSVSAHFSTLRLHKLQPPRFDGDVLHWREFWDGFESSVDRNPHLQPVDKFHYLRDQLGGSARAVVAGLELTNTNYTVAVRLLTERFGNKDTIRDAHITQLMNLPVSSLNSRRLRDTYDTVEQHMRSLATLGNDVKHPTLLTLLRSKLSGPLLTDLEKQKPPDEVWTVTMLRDLWNRHLLALEAAEKYGGRCRPRPQDMPTWTPRGTTEALIVTGTETQQRGGGYGGGGRTDQGNGVTRRMEKKCH